MPRVAKINKKLKTSILLNPHATDNLLKAWPELSQSEAIRLSIAVCDLLYGRNESIDAAHLLVDAFRKGIL